MSRDYLAELEHELNDDGAALHRAAMDVWHAADGMARKAGKQPAECGRLADEARAEFLRSADGAAVEVAPASTRPAAPASTPRPAAASSGQQRPAAASSGQQRPAAGAGRESGGREYRIELRRKAAAFDALQAGQPEPGSGFRVQGSGAQPGGAVDAAALVALAVELGKISAAQAQHAGELAELRAAVGALSAQQQQPAADLSALRCDVDELRRKVYPALADSLEAARAKVHGGAAAPASSPASAAATLGARGGAARAAGMTVEQRSAAASKAVTARHAANRARKAAAGQAAGQPAAQNRATEPARELDGYESGYN